MRIYGFVRVRAPIALTDHNVATLAAHCSPEYDVIIVDQHVEPLRLDDEPDLVVLQAYITNAYRAYAIADNYRQRENFT